MLTKGRSLYREYLCDRLAYILHGLLRKINNWRGTKMKNISSVRQQVKQLWTQWLSFAVFTQAGSALEGNHQQLYADAAENFNRYGVEKRRM
ncbi:hypothetical protein [Tatumella citrea]|uniref:Uncharacterized protein n=1 Tax=Tatumella citrea TaxID=53336 RepID=A0A1Y0LLH6_TATCI|nr:hypothetical protein [Tatumella citrea]ARU94687.1 hypothetical protein A7K98_13530 [Tatumella citrea]ARU98725.1 hypothetical protein A7K99_13515 [Tatumella citrea]